MIRVTNKTVAKTGMIAAKIRAGNSNGDQRCDSGAIKSGAWVIITSCHIAVYRKRANLGFNRGAELEYPDCMLVGEGKIIRHIKVKSP